MLFDTTPEPETVEKTFSTASAGRISRFLEATGEKQAYESYESLREQYEDRRLEPELSVEIGEEYASYTLEIGYELDRKGYSNGSPGIISLLTGRRHLWPQEFHGNIGAERASKAYEKIRAEHMDHTTEEV